VAGAGLSVAKEAQGFRASALQPPATLILRIDKALAPFFQQNLGILQNEIPPSRVFDAVCSLPYDDR